MNRATLGILMLALAIAASAQSADFTHIREHSAVTLVLGTGGECHGNVSRRVEGALSIMLMASSPDCGVRGNIVTVRREHTQSVEIETRVGPSTRRKSAAVATAFAVGILIPHLPAKAMLGVGAGGLEAVHVMNRDMDRAQSAKRYVIYVSKLE